MRRLVETVGATQGLPFLRRLSGKARRFFSPERGNQVGGQTPPGSLQILRCGGQTATVFVYCSKILGFAGKDILSELEDTARRLLQLRESADGGRDSD